MYARIIPSNSKHTYILEQQQPLMENDFALPNDRKKKKREVFKHC